MTSIRLPRLLSADLQELCRLSPLSLSLEQRLSPLSTAVMTLPPDAPPVETGQFMELYTARGSAGIFRIEQVERSFPSTTRITLAHGLVTLSDGLLITSADTTQAAADLFRDILACQSLWQPGTIALPGDALITRRAGTASLLEVLTALMTEYPDYYLSFDQSATPWTLHLLPLSDTVAAEGRLTRNLRSLTIETDRSELCTQLYLPGVEEPLQADTISRWGVVSRSLSTDAGLTAEEIASQGARYLELHKEPLITVTMDAFDLCAVTGSTLDRFQLGSLCRICLPEETASLTQRIVALSYPDVYATPELLRITLANQVQTAASVLAGLIVDTTQVRKQVVRQWDTLAQHKELILSAEESITLLSKEITLHASDILTLRAGVEDNLAEIVLLDGRITANANEIDLHASDILTLRSGVDDNAAQITLLDGRITANANEIDLHAADILTLRSGVDDNAAQITLMDGRISANAKEIALKADKIDLQGYVTMEEFEALEGTVNNLWTDQLIVESLSANYVTGGEADFDNIVFGTIAGKTSEEFVMDIVSAKDYATSSELSAQAGEIYSWVLARNYLSSSALTTATVKVLTGASFAATGEIAVRDAEGSIIGTALTGGKINYSTTEITYLVYA